VASFWASRASGNAINEDVAFVFTEGLHRGVVGFLATGTIGQGHKTVKGSQDLRLHKFDSVKEGYVSFHCLD
jgi:hypothetical protein